MKSNLHFEFAELKACFQLSCDTPVSVRLAG